MTACGEDVGLCPRPRLRHRRVNAGVWPNWRCAHVAWPIVGGRWCRVRDFTGRYPFNTCGTYQDHLETIERKEKLLAFVRAQQQGARVRLPEATYVIDSTPNGAEGAFGALLDSMVRQSRNISDNMGISPLWDREPEIINPPDTTWWAQYPEPTSRPPLVVSRNNPSPPQGSKTYKFGSTSFTVALPDEDRPGVSDYSPLLAAALPQQPAPNSSTSTSQPTPEQKRGHPTTPAPPQSSPSRSS